MRASFIIGLSAASLFALASCNNGSKDDNESDGESLGGTEDTGADASGNPSGDSGSGSASQSGDDGGDDDGDEGGDGVEPLYDVGTIPDTPEFGCGGKSGGGGGGVQLSYIWISNSSQGTISKINTETIEEEGRYYAKPSNGDPSRTSVNLSGDVAVANRNGGVAKFWADVNDCQDNNGMAGIQTSEGASDILAWGDDDCLAWYTPFTCSSNRPVAWTRGEWSEAVCDYVDAKLWTVCDASVHLLDGDTGEIDETVVVPGGVFMYGGAADGDGNFWGLNTSGQSLVRVDHETYELETYPLGSNGGYGITVDKEGRPWTCGGGGVSRFNLDDATWDNAGPGFGIGGCMSDGDELIWHSTGSGLLQGFNIETLSIDASVQLPEYVHGVSVDFYGYVWGVSFAGSNAYRADPESGDVENYGALVGAYTYSDMTGFQLSTAGGGQPPQG